MAQSCSDKSHLKRSVGDWIASARRMPIEIKEERAALGLLHASLRIFFAQGRKEGRKETNALESVTTSHLSNRDLRVRVARLRDMGARGVNHIREACHTSIFTSGKITKQFTVLQKTWVTHCPSRHRCLGTLQCPPVNIHQGPKKQTRTDLPDNCGQCGRAPKRRKIYSCHIWRAPNNRNKLPV